MVQAGKQINFYEELWFIVHATNFEIWGYCLLCCLQDWLHNCLSPVKNTNSKSFLEKLLMASRWSPHVKLQGCGTTKSALHLPLKSMKTSFYKPKNIYLLWFISRKKVLLSRENLWRFIPQFILIISFIFKSQSPFLKGCTIFDSCVKNQMAIVVVVFLGFLFCSIGVHACSCASAMLILVIWPWSIIWTLALWYF
jgi:hypothetical protein